MRGLVLALVLVGAALTALPMAEAHEEVCELGDMVCWIECQAPHYVKSGEGHSCRWNYGPPP